MPYKAIEQAKKVAEVQMQGFDEAVKRAKEKLKPDQDETDKFSDDIILMMLGHAC